MLFYCFETKSDYFCATNDRESRPKHYFLVLMILTNERDESPFKTFLQIFSADKNSLHYICIRNVTALHGGLPYKGSLLEFDFVFELNLFDYRLMIFEMNRFGLFVEVLDSHSFTESSFLLVKLYMKKWGSFSLNNSHGQ